MQVDKHDALLFGALFGVAGGEDTGPVFGRLESSWAADTTGHPRAPQLSFGEEGEAVAAPWGGEQGRRMRRPGFQSWPRPVLLGDRGLRFGS